MAKPSKPRKKPVPETLQPGDLICNRGNKFPYIVIQEFIAGRCSYTDKVKARHPLTDHEYTFTRKKVRKCFTNDLAEYCNFYKMWGLTKALGERAARRMVGNSDEVITAEHVCKARRAGKTALCNHMTNVQRCTKP